MIGRIIDYSGAHLSHAVIYPVCQPELLERSIICWLFWSSVGWTGPQYHLHITWFSSVETVMKLICRPPYIYRESTQQIHSRQTDFTSSRTRMCSEIHRQQPPLYHFFNKWHHVYCNENKVNLTKHKYGQIRKFDASTHSSVNCHDAQSNRCVGKVTGSLAV